MKKFTVLVGMCFVMFGAIGFDPFGCVISNEVGLAIYSTYLGKGPAQFMFLSTANDIEIRIAEDSDQR